MKGTPLAQRVSIGLSILIFGVVIGFMTNRRQPEPNELDCRDVPDGRYSEHRVVDGVEKCCMPHTEGNCVR